MNTPKAPSPWPPRLFGAFLGSGLWVADENDGYTGGVKDVEYLSLEEHTHLLAEAVREVKAQVYSEIADRIDMMAMYDEIDEMASEYKAKAADLRTPGETK